MKIFVSVALGALALAAPVLGQAEEARAPLAKSIELDLAIPDAPGFSVIGLTPTAVIDPSSARMKLAQIANYTDDKGNLKPGFALGGQPFFWFSNITLQRYQDLNGPVRALARTQLSLGFAEGGDDKPDHVGLGFTTELLGAADYRLQTIGGGLYDCVEKAYGDVFGGFQLTPNDVRAEAIKAVEKDPTSAGLTPAQWNERVNDKVAELLQAGSDEATRIIKDKRGPEYATALSACRKTFTDQAAQRPSWTFAGGMAWRSKGGGLDSRVSDGGSLWTAYKHPLGWGKPSKLADDSGGLPNYLTLFGRYDFDKEAETPAGSPTGVQRYDRLTAALMTGYQWSAGTKVSLEAGYQKMNYDKGGPLTDVSARFYALTATMKIQEGLWLELKAGSNKSNPAAPEDRDDKVAFSFRYSPPAPQ